jgi:transposase
MAAFDYLGGVPQSLVLDNLKTTVIQTAFGTVRDTLVVNHGYRELARHYRFHIDPTPPRAPRKKGKVESGVKNLKHSFFECCRERRYA